MAGEVVTQWMRGPAGVGLPAGGEAGQMPVKASADDWDIVWVTPGGGGGPVTWASITAKPTTLVGFGITDAATAAQGALAATAVQPGALSAVAISGAYGDLSGRPTTWAWGSLTGSLSAQTDLVAALAGKAALADGISGAERTKLAGIATGATANSADATLLARANHTGTQAWGTITGTPTTLAGYGIVDAGGAPAWGGITGTLASQTDLAAALALKANAAALATVATSGAYSDLSGRPTSWAWGTITGTPTTLSGYGITDAAPTARTLSTTAPLTGGGDLSANRTLAISAATTGAAGSMSAADKTKLDGIATAATANSTDAALRARSSHTGTQLAATISDFSTAIAADSTVTALGARMQAVEITQAAYDLLSPPDANTLYVVVG